MIEQVAFVTRLHTPWKINMEPNNGGVWKIISLSIGGIWGSMFQG